MYTTLYKWNPSVTFQNSINKGIFGTETIPIHQIYAKLQEKKGTRSSKNCLFLLKNADVSKISKPARFKND